MLGRTHALTGLAAGLTVATLAGLTAATPLPAYLVAAGAALLPDLDQPRSMANRTVATKPAHIFLRRFAHRTFTHSLLALGLWFAALYIGREYANSQGVHLPFAYVIMATVGWGSHIFADMFNKQGVQLFYPFEPLGQRFISMPIPRYFRIGTKYDPEITLNPLSVQSVIHTEMLFWAYPMATVVAVNIYWQGLPLAQAFLRLLSTY